MLVCHVEIINRWSVETWRVSCRNLYPLPSELLSQSCSTVLSFSFLLAITLFSMYHQLLWTSFYCFNNLPFSSTFLEAPNLRSPCLDPPFDYSFLYSIWGLFPSSSFQDFPNRCELSPELQLVICETLGAFMIAIDKTKSIIWVWCCRQHNVDSLTLTGGNY